MKQQLKGGAEWDWTGRGRHFYCYTARPGVGKSIKRGMNKRFRREAVTDIAAECDDLTPENVHKAPEVAD